jgi:hypothetical protein
MRWWVMAWIWLFIPCWSVSLGSIFFVDLLIAVRRVLASIVSGDGVDLAVYSLLEPCLGRERARQTPQLSSLTANILPRGRRVASNLAYGSYSSAVLCCGGHAEPLSRLCSS